MRSAFRDDPYGCARRWIIRATCDQAHDGQVENTSPRSMMRASQALELLAAGTGDPETGEVAAAEALRTASNGAAVPAGTASQVAIKLAILVRELARPDPNTPPEEAALRLKLASCALSDLVLTGDRPLHLPAGACELLGRRDVAAWRRHAARHAF